MAKVLPEWIDGDLGGPLQSAYDKSLDGSVVTDATRGSVDLRGITGTWDAPILTVGYTGYAPTTSLSKYNGIVTSDHSVLNDSERALIICGFSGTIKEYSHGSMILGGADNEMRDVAYESVIIESNKAMISRSKHCSINYSDGRDDSTSIPVRDYSTISQLDLSYSGTLSSENMPGFTGLCEIRGHSDLGTDIFSINTNIEGSLASIAEKVEQVRIDSSSEIFIKGMTGTSIPVRRTSVGSSDSIAIEGSVEHSSVNSSVRSVLIGTLGATGSSTVFGSKTSNINSSSDSILYNTSESSINSSKNCRIVSSNNRENIACTISSSQASVINAGNDCAIVGSKESKIGDLSYWLGKFQIPDPRGLSMSSSVLSSDRSSIHMATSSSILASRGAVINSIREPGRNNTSMTSAIVASDNGAYVESSVSCLIASSKATIDQGWASAESWKELSNERVRIIKSFNSSILSSGSEDDSQNYIDIYESVACSIVSCESFDAPYLSGSQGWETGITGGSHASMLDTSTRCFISRATQSSIRGSADSSLIDSNLSSIRNSVGTSIGVLPEGYTGLVESWTEGLDDPPNFNLLVSDSSRRGTQNFEAVSMARSTIPGSDRSFAAAGSDIILVWNNDSAFLGGQSNTMVSSDRSVSLAGSNNTIGPFSNDSVMGGGYQNEYKEFINGLGVGNIEGDFKKSNNSFVSATYGCSFFRVIRSSAVASSLSSIEESTDVSISSSRDSTIYLSKRVGIDSSLNSIITGNSYQVRIVASDGANVEDSYQSSLISSSSSGIVSSSNTKIQASYLSNIFSSTESEISSSKNSEIAGGENSAVIASDGALASHKGELARSNGSFETIGDAQSSNFILRGFTDDTGSGSQDLLLNGYTGVGATGHINLTTNSAYSVKAKIVGKGMTGAVSCVLHAEGMLTADESWVHTDNMVYTYTGCSSDNVMQDPTVSVGATGLWFNIEVPSISGLEARWMADVSLSKLDF